MTKLLIDRIKIGCFGLDPIDPLRVLLDEVIEALAQPAQRTWVGLIRGVRVEGDTVVISVKGGNDAARELCSELVNEMGVRNGA